jgi:hypothetical protein
VGPGSSLVGGAKGIVSHADQLCVERMHADRILSITISIARGRWNQSSAPEPNALSTIENKAEGIRPYDGKEYGSPSLIITQRVISNVCVAVRGNLTF